MFDDTQVNDDVAQEGQEEVEGAVAEEASDDNADSGEAATE